MEFINIYDIFWNDISSSKFDKYTIKHVFIINWIIDWIQFWRSLSMYKLGSVKLASDKKNCVLIKNLKAWFKGYEVFLVDRCIVYLSDIV